MISLEYCIACAILLTATIPASFTLADVLNDRLKATEQICLSAPASP